MHEGRWAQCRAADHQDFRQELAVPDWSRVGHAKVHEQVVRMLVVDERRLLVGFTCLEDLRRAQRLNRERLEREHRVEPGMTVADRVFGSEHQPVRRLDTLEVGELSVLIVPVQKDVGVPRPRPRPALGYRLAHVIRLPKRRCGQTSEHEHGNERPRQTDRNESWMPGA